MYAYMTDAELSAEWARLMVCEDWSSAHKLVLVCEECQARRLAPWS